MTGFTHSAALECGSLLPSCMVILACFCFATIPDFAKSLTDSGLAAYAVAFYRYGLSALVLFPLLQRLPATQMKTAASGIWSRPL